MNHSNQQSQTEFYSPFAHIPGRYEWCRIHSPSHGSFDTFIIIEDRTDTAVSVYVNSDAGERFMAERYPESRCIRVADENLNIAADAGCRRVEGRLIADSGPVSRAEMVFETKADTGLKESAYGGSEYAVWGSRWSCTGVDMEAAAAVTGLVEREGRVERVSGEAVVTMGSYGTISPL